MVQNVGTVITGGLAAVGAHTAYKGAQGLATTVGEGFNSGLTWVKGVGEAIKGAPAAFGEAITSAPGKAIEAGKDFVKEVPGVFADVADDFAGALQGEFTDEALGFVDEGIGALRQGAVGAVDDVIAPAVQAVAQEVGQEAGEGLLSRFGSFLGRQILGNLDDVIPVAIDAVF